MSPIDTLKRALGAPDVILELQALCECDGNGCAHCRALRRIEIVERAIKGRDMQIRALAESAEQNTARIRALEDQLGIKREWGAEQDAVCNRDGCEGRMHYRHSDGSTCLGPPCNLHCGGARLECADCYEISGDYVP